MSPRAMGHSAQQDIPSCPMTPLAQYRPFWEVAFQWALLLFHVYPKLSSRSKCHHILVKFFSKL